MPQLNFSYSFFHQDPSFPLGSLQNPYPPGEGPDDDPTSGAQMGQQLSRSVDEDTYSQHVRPEDVLGSGSAASLTPNMQDCVYQPSRSSRSSSPLPPPRPQAYVDVYPTGSNHIRRPRIPNSHSHPRREPPSPNLPPRHVHFNEDLSNDDRTRRRQRRDATERLNALDTSDSHEQRQRAGQRNGHRPPSPAPLRTGKKLSPPAISPRRAPAVRAPADRAPDGSRRVDVGPRGSRNSLLHGMDLDVRGEMVSSRHRSEPYDGGDNDDSDYHDYAGSGLMNDFNCISNADVAALDEPPLWQLCAMCNEKPHNVKAKGMLYCWACYGDVCAAERAQPWERCWVCENKPGVHQQGGSWFCKECYGEACAAEKKHKKGQGRGR